MKNDREDQHLTLEYFILLEKTNNNSNTLQNQRINQIALLFNQTVCNTSVLCKHQNIEPMLRIEQRRDDDDCGAITAAG